MQAGRLNLISAPDDDGYSGHQDSEMVAGTALVLDNGSNEPDDEAQFIGRDGKSNGRYEFRRHNSNLLGHTADGVKGGAPHLTLANLEIEDQEEGAPVTRLADLNDSDAAIAEAGINEEQTQRNSIEQLPSRNYNNYKS